MLAFLSTPHFIIIGGIALLLFGNRLPEVARSLGRAMNEFKRGLREVGEGMNIDKSEPPAPGQLQPPTEQPVPRAPTATSPPVATPTEKHD